MAGQPPEWTRIFHYQGFWSKYKACKEMMMLVFPVRRYTKNVSSGNQPWGLSSNCGLSNSGVGHRPTTTHIFTCSGITVCLLYKSSVWSCAGIIIGTLLVVCLRMVPRIVLLIWLFEHHSLRTRSSFNGWWLLLVTPFSPILSYSSFIRCLNSWILETFHGYWMPQ